MAEDSKRDDIIKAVTDIEFRPDTSITEIELRHAVKLPFDKLSIAGVALGSLPEAVRTVTSRIPGGETLLRATDAAGNPIPANLLQKFSDGTGLLGSTRINGNFGQVRLHEVANVGSTVTTTVPYNPAMLFAAAALALAVFLVDLAVRADQDEVIGHVRAEHVARADFRDVRELGHGLSGELGGVEGAVDADCPQVAVERVVAGLLEAGADQRRHDWRVRDLARGLVAADLAETDVAVVHRASLL